MRGVRGVLTVLTVLTVLGAGSAQVLAERQAGCYN